MLRVELISSNTVLSTELFADTIGDRIYYAQVDLADTAPVSITARAKWQQANTETVVAEKMISVARGYPASVSLPIPPDNVATFSDGSEDYLVGRESSLYAVVTAGEHVGAQVLEPLFGLLEQRGAMVDRQLRRTSDGDVFFLVDVIDVADVRAVLRMMSGEGMHPALPAYQSMVGLVLNQRGKKVTLAVLDPEPRAGSTLLFIRRVIPATLSPYNPVDAFLLGARESPRRLRLAREGVGVPKIGAPSLVMAPEVAQADMLGFSEARQRLLARGHGSNGLLSSSWSIATLELGTVNDTHPWVDRCNLTQAVQCDEDMYLPTSLSPLPQGCSNRILTQNRIHATSVYGVLSARDTTNTSCTSGSDRQLANGFCGGGAIPGIPHLALCSLDPSPGTSPDGACFQVADSLRWLAGLATPRHPSWPGLPPSKTARVINVSRGFTLLSNRELLGRQARDYLNQALEDVTKHSHGGLGAVVVLTLENKTRPIMEDQLSLPCRNSMLVVGPSKASTGSIYSGGLAWGPVASVVAPSNSLQLLSRPGTDDESCGVFSGPAASFSTAMVSAAAAMVMLSDPALTSTRVAEIVRHTASSVDVEQLPEEDRPEDAWFRMTPDRSAMLSPPGSQGPVLGGPSLMNGECWVSLRFGHGNIDVLRALHCTLDMSCPA